jgi:hypothetical protein
VLISSGNGLRVLVEPHREQHGEAKSGYRSDEAEVYSAECMTETVPQCRRQPLQQAFNHARSTSFTFSRSSLFIALTS